MTRSFFATSFRSFVLAISAATVLFVAGCGSFGDKVTNQRNWTVEQFYKNAREEMDSGNYQGAIKLYEALEARYPFGRFTQQAQLDIAYSYYKDNETAQAVTAADRFMKLHPNHPNLDYALYLKGLAYFKPDLGIFGSVLNLDASERDPKALRDSFDVFKELVTRFPDSIYAEDSRGRMIYLVNTLARHDITVARYYFNRGAYLAAVNRAQNVITRYPQAPLAEEALQISVAAYGKMGMPEMAKASQRVLEKNFPATAKEESKRSWWKFWQ
jgi:outer membrane protein assembly factor BamD